MQAYLYSEKTNCKNCYKCIRFCPVKSIGFSNNQARILQEDCIFCGRCYINCPQQAKRISPNIEDVRKMIGNGETVAASIAPSFAAYFEGVGIENMKKALEKLGFHYVEETAVGATIVKKEYEKLVAEGKQSIIISSSCPTLNLYIQKYYPEALPYLANVVTPMEAHCMNMKDRYPDIKTVFIGPCISKKFEGAEVAKNVDTVLTFDELADWLEAAGLEIDKGMEPKADKKGRARFFPMPGGILKTMDCNDPRYTYISIDGLESCKDTLEGIKNKEIDHCFIEMSACTGSCSGGPILQKKRNIAGGIIQVMKYAGTEDFDIELRENQKEGAFQKDYPYMGHSKLMPGEKAITEILAKMGKTRPEDELNCGSCGYPTCKAKALAIFQGKASYTMCLPYLIAKAESFSDNIISNTPNGIFVLNQDLEVQQINEAACRILNLKNPQVILGNPIVRLLDPAVYANILEEKRDVYEVRQYLADYDKYVEQTVIHDKSYGILICIMKDITDDVRASERKEKLGQEAAETANLVVEKQMRIVQEIASLLGESAAETKIALTRLKESLNNE